MKTSNLVEQLTHGPSEDTESVRLMAKVYDSAGGECETPKDMFVEIEMKFYVLARQWDPKSCLPYFHRKTL